MPADAAEIVRLGDLPERIAKRISIEPVSQCWNWTSPNSLVGRGRGYVSLNGRPMLHHRAVWTILRSPIPAGAYLCHHCDNPKCCNPEHLYVGDSRTNVRDMMLRGRHWTQVEPHRAKTVGIKSGAKNTWSKAERNPKAKLSRAQALEIAASTKGSRELGRLYGVDRTTIQRIRKGALWTS